MARGRRNGRRRGSRAARIAIGAAAVAIAALVVNGVYQVIRKPSELLFPVSSALYKTPEQTWRAYGVLFRRYATPTIPGPLLASLAQQEGSGNPLVRTYWRFAWAPRPFDIYRPASSAVGMYQITDGTFAAARHYCVHDHAVVHEGAWNDWHTCWFNGLYARVVPADAVELTAGYLDVTVNELIARHGLAASAARLRHIAAMVHLCGPGAADAYVAHGLRLNAGQRCGDHDPRVYLRRIDELNVEFTRLAAEAPQPQ